MTNHCFGFLSAFAASALIFLTPARAAIIGINPASSTLSVTFDDTNSQNSSSVAGTTFATVGAGPSGGGPIPILPLSLPLTTDPITLDQATTFVLAISGPTNYGVFLNGTQLTQAIGNSGYAEMVVQFNVQYLTDAAGLGPQIVALPSVNLNGTVQPGGLSSFRGFIQMTSAAQGSLGHVDYNYTNVTSGAFTANLGGTFVGASTTISLPAFDTLTLSGFYTLRVDPSSINVEIVPEPSSGLLALMSLPLLWKRRRS